MKKQSYNKFKDNDLLSMYKDNMNRKLTKPGNFTKMYEAYKSIN